MKNYIFLILILIGSFLTTAQAGPVDVFAQGLANIVAKLTPTLVDLYQKILGAYKNDKFDEVKKLLENAPQELFGKIEIDGRYTTLLFDLIRNYSNYLVEIKDIFILTEETRQERLEKENILKLVVRKSSSEQLLMTDTKRNRGNTALTLAVTLRLPSAIIKQLLEKAPKLLDPDFFGEGLNEVLKSSVDNYARYPFTGGVPSVNEIIRDAQNVCVIIEESKEIVFDKETVFFKNLVIRILMEPFLDEFYIAMRLKENTDKALPWQQGIVDIFKALVAREPEIAPLCLPWLLNRFLEVTIKKEQEFLAPFIESISSFYKNLFKNRENEKIFKIKEDDEKLTAKGLSAGESYTLEEILKATGLKDVLK